MLRRVPLIVILGSTGTGKTKLSIELARKFNGEVISADSMQVYSDLDIVTAKATRAEQSIVKHHLIDITKPSDEPFTVKHFRDLSLPIINELLKESKFPIVVGGTNYYIESLLWDILVSPQLSPSKSESNDAKEPKRRRSSSSNNYGDSSSVAQNQDVHPSDNDNDDDSASQHSTPSNDSSDCDLELESMSPEELHERLKLVDPITAGRIHPNNRRKILRALEIFYQSGKPLSEFIQEQRCKPGGNRLGGPLRYPHTILLWLRCDQEVLNERLDKRVDAMLTTGLLAEVRNFYEIYLKEQSASQYTKGILQSIGFKEFVPYLEKFGIDQDKTIDDYLRNISYKLTEMPAESEPEGLDLLRRCLAELKLVTRRYSKRQIKWIKNRFLGSADRQVPALYALDTSDVSRWESNVSAPAIDIIESYINEKSTSIEPMAPIQHPGTGLNEESYRERGEFAMTTRFTECDLKHGREAQEVLRDITDALKNYHRNEQDEFNLQTEELDRLWVLAQRFSILSNGAPGESLYPKMIVNHVKCEMMEQMHDHIKAIRKSNSRLEKVLSDLTPSYQKLSDVLAEIDWHVNGGVVVGDEIFKPISYYVENVVDWRKTFQKFAADRRAKEYVLNIRSVESIELYQTMLKSTENSKRSFAKDICFSSLLTPTV